MLSSPPTSFTEDARHKQHETDTKWQTCHKVGTSSTKSTPRGKQMFIGQHIFSLFIWLYHCIHIAIKSAQPACPRRQSFLRQYNLRDERDAYFFAIHMALSLHPHCHEQSSSCVSTTAVVSTHIPLESSCCVSTISIIATRFQPKARFATQPKGRQSK